MAFFAVCDRIAPATNKYMATLWNGATGRVVVVDRVYRFNWQVAAVTGVFLEQELRFITARTAGTGVQIQTEDSNDTPTANIACDTGSTSVTEGTGSRALIKRFFAPSEEVSLAGAWGLAHVAGHINDAQLVWYRKAGSSGLVLRLNQGITIKNLTNSTVGTCSYGVEFRDLAA